MARKDRYPGVAGRSEYGGGDGDPQRTPDGASLDLPGIASATGERAALMRSVGINDFDPERSDLVGLAATGLDVSKMSAAQREAYEADLEISRRRALQREGLADRFNGYTDELDQYVGEGGENNGVAPLN